MHIGSTKFTSELRRVLTKSMSSFSCLVLVVAFVAATTAMGEERANFQVTCEGNIAIQPPEGKKWKEISIDATTGVASYAVWTQGKNRKEEKEKGKLLHCFTVLLDMSIRSAASMYRCASGTVAYTPRVGSATTPSALHSDVFQFVYPSLTAEPVPAYALHDERGICSI